MRPKACSHEDAVSKAASADIWDGDPLRRHADACPICGPAARVASALRRLANADRASAPALPDPRAVLLRARLVERFEMDRRATQNSLRPIAWMDAVLLASGLGLVAWLSGRAAVMLDGLPFPLLSGSVAGTMVAVASGLGLVVLLATVRALSTEG